MFTEASDISGGHAVKAQTHQTDIKKLAWMKADASGPKGCIKHTTETSANNQHTAPV